MSGITSIKTLTKPLGYDNGGEVKNEGINFLAEPIIKPTDIDPLYDETGGSRLDIGKTKFSGGFKTPAIVDKVAKGIFNALNPFKKAKFIMNLATNKPFSTNLMSKNTTIDDLLNSGQIKKGSELTDDPENLMAIERDRFQTIAEAKGRSGKLLEVGGEGTEGTFKYKGETYNKSDGVLIGYKSKRRNFEKQWIPKEKYGKPPDAEASRQGSLKGSREKRLKNINEYYPN
jgi:hypothetical protein